jgi:two-component system OmpR family response regulator
MDFNHDPAPSTIRPHVLVVDDDPEICQLLIRYLGSNGYQVSAASSGAQLRSKLREDGVDLILLDLGLPDDDGLSLLRELQHGWHGSVIVVSGRGEPVERVVGLELGADDYISKPFELRELLARVRSVLRRARPESPAAAAGACQRLEFDGLHLDLSARQLLDRRGQPVALTSGEFDLLQAMLERPSQVLTRDQLMNRMHGHAAGPFDRAIDVQVGRLRRKIEVDPTRPRLIKSVRGAGYLFASPVRKL